MWDVRDVRDVAGFGGEGGILHPFYPDRSVRGVRFNLYLDLGTSTHLSLHLGFKGLYLQFPFPPRIRVGIRESGGYGGIRGIGGISVIWTGQ